MKHDLDYMLQVMQAAKEGKTIEGMRNNGEVWFTIANPKLHRYNWEEFYYRIKPEPPKPEYVPYESAEEFLQGQKEHGMYIKCDDCYNPYSKDEGDLCYVIPTEILSNNICFCNLNNIEETHIMVSFRDLVNYIWADGTPVGKLKQ